MDHPILYSFRRCPYAIRARLAILVADQTVNLREIVLRDKAEEFLKTSPSGTVPCLKLPDRVLDESLDIMAWALARNDPENWLQMPPEGYQLIAECDGSFKHALDRTKYASRYPDQDVGLNRSKANEFLFKLNSQLSKPYLFGASPRLADMAILPFVRQFAHIDYDVFLQSDVPNVVDWLERFKASTIFAWVMNKYKKWEPDAPVVHFP